MSDACPKCGAPAPAPPYWMLAVPPAIGVASLAAWRIGAGKIPATAVALGATACFAAFTFVLYRRLRAVVSGTCPGCGSAGQ